jgi:hypothetical protein
MHQFYDDLLSGQTTLQDVSDVNYNFNKGK